MAINDNSVKLGNSPEQQAFVPPQQSASKSVFGGRGLTLGGAGLFAAPISRGLGSEIMTKLHTALVEIYKEANPEAEITIIPIDNVNEPALAFSVLVVCMRYKSEPDRVAFHTLILEATGDKIQSVFENNGSKQIEITRVTGDANDQVLMAKVYEKVRIAFPNAAAIIETDACVIPRQFNPEDKTKVHLLALNAGLADGTFLEVTRKDFEDLNLASARDESQLVVNIQFNNNQMEDAVGEPMRSDFLINFSSQRNATQANKSINSGDRQVALTEISGFFDTVWAPVAQGPLFQPQWNPQMPMPTQKYAARAVITNLASNFSFTPSGILLALATAATLRDDNNWVQAFRPHHVSATEIDMRDIGALNIEANLSNEPNFGTRIDTKSENFRLEDLGSLIAAMFQPGMILSLDVPEVGAQTWYLSMFLAASSGSQDALSAIYHHANVLTNGAFEQYFPQGKPMFVDVGNRVHLGHWVDRSGVRRDIRDIDTIAVANMLGERSPEKLRAWSDTWTRLDYSLTERMHERKKLIMGLTNETAEFTGFAQRVTFSAEFVDALTRGCRDAGLGVRIQTPLSSADFNNTRGVATFAGQALLTGGKSFLHTGGFGYNTQFPGAVQGAHTRWAR